MTDIMFYRALNARKYLVLHVTQIKFRSRIGWTRLMPNKWIMEIRVLKNETCSFIYSFEQHCIQARAVSRGGKSPWIKLIH